MYSRILLWAYAAALGLAAVPPAATGGEFDPGRAAFSIRVGDDLVIPYRVFAVYVVPGEAIRVRVAAPAHAEYTLVARGGRAAENGRADWVWTAPPAPSVAALTISSGADTIRLNALVMHPARAVRRGVLNGYQIGEYPPPLDGDPVYAQPDGFFELAEHHGDLELSPHFRLSQFPSKQSRAFPKYLVLREQLLLKLELLLEHVNANGVAADTFTVMSGFRTPSYNRSIGNGRHSRHVFGGGADIYVDVAPQDGIMDDLNGDGVRDYRDAQWLYALADELFGSAAQRHLQGGLGVYRSTSTHGPFLHVDARGKRARWGLVP